MYKGFIANKKKGALTTLTSSDVFVVEKPVEAFEETDPTVPSHVKAITSGDINNWVTGFNNNIISGSVTGDINKILTLTKRNGTTLSIPFTDISGEMGDDVINTLSFNSSTGVLTAVTSEGILITTNLDGRYSLLNHTHSWDSITGKPATYPSSPHTHNYENPLVFQNGDLINIERTTNNIKISKVPKPIQPLNIVNPTMIFPDSYWNTKWINITGNNPNLSIGSQFVVVGHEIEGSFVGTGRLTIEGSVDMTLIWADEFFTNTYPAGGVFGIKVISATTAVLFGKQIPIGL